MHPEYGHSNMLQQSSPASLLLNRFILASSSGFPNETKMSEISKWN
jgi:hypothetical protein